MNILEIKYKYKVGQVIYFMYNNEIRKGVVDSIYIIAETSMLKCGLIKKIVDRTINIFSDDYPFTTKIRYSLNLVSKSGDFESSPHMLYEYNVHETQKDIIYNLSM